MVYRVTIWEVWSSYVKRTCWGTLRMYMQVENNNITSAKAQKYLERRRVHSVVVFSLKGTKNGNILQRAQGTGGLPSVARVDKME